MTSQSTIKRRPGRPTSNNKVETRTDLIEAALHCFGDKGFDGASLSQIAGLAKTDIGLTRYYFGSKEALWFVAVDDMSHKLGTELEVLLARPHSGHSDQLADVIRWFVDMSARYPYLNRIIVLDGASNDVRARHIAKNLVAPFYEVLRQLIRAAKREGRIPDVAVRTIFFMITHGGSFPMAMPALTNAFPGGKISTPRALKAHADAIIALVMREA